MTSPAKIALNPGTAIAFNKLFLSKRNVRRIVNGETIPELADDIYLRGLIQSLNVRPEANADGKQTGRFEVTAGGRRFRALELLVKQKRMAKTEPVPVIVKAADSAISAEEDSLAENVHREAMHPLDQFRAFKALVDGGLSEADVAARFFVSPAVVRQRLKLTTVSPQLLEVYVAGEMRLDQLEAFSVSDDHARQEGVWGIPNNGYNKEPHHIRRALTEGAADASRDKRAIFVGVAAYEAAGGTVMRDLFTPDHGGYLTDIVLLNRLAQAKMEELVANLTAEGWRWVEASIEGFPWGHNRHLRQIEPAEAEMSAEEQARYSALTEEYDRIRAEHEGEYPDDVDEHLGEIEQQIEVMEETCARRYSAEQHSYAGAYIDLDHNGEVRINRGWVRQQDEPEVEPAAAVGEPATGHVERVVLTIGGGETAGPEVPEAQAAEPEDDNPERPISAALMTELTIQRTAALREAVAADPGAAFVTVLYTMVLGQFYGALAYVPGQPWRTRSAESCLELTYRSTDLRSETPGLAQAPSVVALEARRQTWGDRLPQDATRLWAYLVALDADSRADLFALCAGLTVNAVSAPLANAYGMDRAKALAHADQIAELVGLDMSEQWAPTAENYLGRVTKGRIQAAVREAKGEATASLIDHLKRPDMAREAERLLAGTGWLPQPLRTRGVSRDNAPAADVPVPAGVVVEAAQGDEALPAFLADEEADGEELTHDEEGVEPLPDHFLDGPMPTDLDGFDPEYHAIAAE